MRGKFEPGIEAWNGLPVRASIGARPRKDVAAPTAVARISQTKSERAPRPPFALPGKEIIEHGAHR